MKMIQAIIRPSKVEEVKNALDEAGYTSLTSIEIKGRGRQKVKVELVVPDDKEDEVVEIIRKAAYTGNIGDGKIFVLPVEKTIRIRTGETDDKAL